MAFLTITTFAWRHSGESGAIVYEYSTADAVFHLHNQDLWVESLTISNEPMVHATTNNRVTDILGIWKRFGLDRLGEEWMGW